MRVEIWLTSLLTYSLDRSDCSTSLPRPL